MTLGDIVTAPGVNGLPHLRQSCHFLPLMTTVWSYNSTSWEYYQSSTFNTCEHQVLTLMASPPLKLMVNPDAEPVEHHTPVPVPLHWRHAVKAGLDHDVQLGVLEPVPIGEPVTWCHRMVICQKEEWHTETNCRFPGAQRPRHARHTTHHHHSTRLVRSHTRRRKLSLMHGMVTIACHSAERTVTWPPSWENPAIQVPDRPCPGVRHRATDCLSRHPTGAPQKLHLPDDVATIGPPPIILTEPPDHSWLAFAPDTGADAIEAGPSRLLCPPWTPCTSNLSRGTGCVLPQPATRTCTPLLALVESVYQPSAMNSGSPRDYFQFRDDLLYSWWSCALQDRIVIPPSLREEGWPTSMLPTKGSPPWPPGQRHLSSGPASPLPSPPPY